MQGGSGRPAGVLPLERPSQLGLEAFRAPAPRYFARLVQSFVSFFCFGPDSRLSTGSSGSGSMKSLFPLPSSPALLPHFGFSCQDAALHTLALPLYGKASATGVSTPGGEAFLLNGEKQRSFPPLPPLSDLPLLSTLQGRKPRLHRPLGSLPPLYSSHFLPDLAEASGPCCLYRYSLPLSSQLISRHPKLAEDTSDSLLRQFPWQLTANHCL